MTTATAFFSTFPRFGVQLTDGTLVSKAIRDTLWQRTDTLVSFKKAVAVVNPMDYGNQYACNGCECSQYDTGHFEYFLGLAFHFVIRSVNIGQGVASFP